MKKLILSFLLIIPIILLLNCEDSVGPENYPPGRRDYVWMADTLKLPQGEAVSFSKMWGASSGDIWICGRATSNPYRLWHYDGSNWKNVDPGFSIIEARDIYGFGYDDIWLGTAFGILAHFDGNTWQYIGDYSTEKEFLVIQEIWGRKTNEIYAVGFLDRKDLSGYKGCILKYDGLEWRYIDIDSLQTNFLSMSYDSKAKKYFLSATKFEDDLHFIYELNGNKLIKLHQGNRDTQVFTMNDKSYFIIGEEVYKYDQSKGLVKWKDFSIYPNFAGILDGRNENDIFTANYVGLGHYNGADQEIIYETDMWFNDIVMFENTILVSFSNIHSGLDVFLKGSLIKN